MIAGALLVVAGAALLLGEAHVSSAGVLGAAGVAAVAVGVGLMLSAAGGGVAVAAVLAAATAVAGAGLLVLVLPAAAATRHRRVRTGREGLVGHVGVVRGAPLAHGRHVFVDGALWRAEQTALEPADEPLQDGDRVVVEAVSGLTLSVRRAEEWELSP